MARLRIDKPVRAALLDELVARGIAPLTPARTTILEPDADGNGGWLTVPDADLAQAQAAIGAHDAAGIDAAAQQETTRRQQVRQIVLAYPDLTTPTNAQTVAAVKALCLAVRELYRP